MSILTTIIYQPFFNLLVGFYYFLERIPQLEADMGLAVILLTVAIRLLMLPLTISATRTKKERHQIQSTINQVKQAHSSNPSKQKSAIRKIFRGNRRILVSESVNFAIQLIIFFVLYRIFTTGLLGADLHLLYDFMPQIKLPFNLTFLGTYDLTKTSLPLNLFQSLTIFIVESISLINSPFPVTRTDIVRYLIILPVASFFIFMFLPAGKKLFVITTLWFSFFFILANFLGRIFSSWFNKPAVSEIPVEPPPVNSAEKPTKVE